MTSLLAVILWTLFILVIAPEWVMAQEQRHVVKLSGYVVGGDSLIAQTGVAVYVPGTNRGTLTQLDGYFSVSVLTGDSVVISAVGFEKQYLKMPERKSSSNFTVDIHLKESVTVLPTVKVIPWATERDLKQALMKLDLPEEPQVNMEFQNIKPARNSILNGPPLDAAGNFKFFRQQQTQQRESRFRAPDVIKLFSIPIH